MFIGRRKRPRPDLDEDTNEEAFDVVYGRLLAKSNQYRAFYYKLRALSHASKPLESSSQEIEHTLTDILVFLSEQVDLKSPITQGVYSLQYLSAQPLLRQSGGSFAEKNILLNQASTHAVSTCLQIFSYMFGADNVNICRQVVVGDQGFIDAFSPAKLRYTMLQHDLEGNSQDHYVAGWMAELNHELSKYILFLDMLLSGKYKAPSHTHIYTYFQAHYQDLATSLRGFTEGLQRRGTRLAFGDMLVLLTEIVGPFFARIEPQNMQLREFSRQCMQHGQFADFGMHLILYTRLVFKRSDKFREFFGYPTVTSGD